tara:strand:+ start:1754 stop:3415 length:1662 start_codon:yes stop_codon:yes gene_type:complete
LVGVRGKFRIEITQRQLVLSNDVRKGIKLDLASISRTRSIDIPTIPGGIIIWGSAACYLGATILIPPLGYAVSLLGGLSVLSHFIFKTPALVIETNIGDRHIIQSRLNDQEVLLKVHMMIEKVSNGQSVRDAKNILEREFRHENKANVVPKALLNAPSINDLVPDVNVDSQLGGSFASISESRFENNFEESNIQLFDNQDSVIEDQFSKPIIPDMGYNEVIQKPSAYEQTWGRNEPEWYNEKKPSSLLQSSLEDATETMETDIFGFGFGAGGLFDSEPAKSSSNEPVNYLSPEKTIAPEQYISNNYQDNEHINSIFGSEYSTEEENVKRSMSSAEMIRVANGLNRSPMNNYSRSLPEPTDEAVRNECRPGLVKRAKAQQSLHRKAEIIASLPAPTDLGEYPGLSRIANSYGGGRLTLRKQPVKKKSTLSLIERLLVPRHRNYERRELDYSSEYGDPDGIEASEGARFQSKQHLRIRSDQEHQADINNRLRKINTTEPSSAKDALEKVVNRVSRGEEHSPTELNSEQPLLRFNQMRRTSNSNDKGHLKGIKRLN